jgi:hypothetical protein
MRSTTVDAFLMLSSKDISTGDHGNNDTLARESCKSSTDNRANDHDVVT